MSTAMEPVVGLANKYKGEFEETYEGLRQRTLKLQETAPQIVQDLQNAVEPQKQELIGALQDMGDVQTPAPVVMSTLSWAGVLVFSTNLTAFVSSYVLAPFVGLFVGGFGATIAALGAVPAYAYYAIQSDLAAQPAASDVQIRFRLLGIALGEGALVGFILSNSYLTAAPIASLTPLVTAVAYSFAQEKFQNNRQMLIGGSVGAAVGLNLVLGLLTGYLTFPYLLLSLLYAGATVATLQFLFKNVPNDTAPTYNYQLLLLGLFVTANLLVHGLLGVTAEHYRDYTAQQAQAQQK